MKDQGKCKKNVFNVWGYCFLTLTQQYYCATKIEHFQEKRGGEINRYVTDKRPCNCKLCNTVNSFFHILTCFVSFISFFLLSFHFFQRHFKFPFSDNETYHCNVFCSYYLTVKCYQCFLGYDIVMLILECGVMHF